MAVATRKAVSNLSEEWDSVGVYILLGDSADGSAKAYAGKAASSGGLRTRLSQHSGDTNKDWWQRVLLVADLTPEGFNSAQAGWVEAELVSTLRNAPAIQCMNGNQPRDDSLPAYGEAELRPIIGDITAVLRVLGVHPDTRDQIEVAPEVVSAKRSDVTVKDLIEAGLLSVGTVLKCAWQNRADLEEEAIVQADGTLSVNGNLHGSPSAAAAELRGGATNGWRFWAVSSSDGRLVELYELRDKVESGSAG